MTGPELRRGPNMTRRMGRSPATELHPLTDFYRSSIARVDLLLGGSAGHLVGT